MNRLNFLLCVTLVWSNASHANKISDFYEIENIKAPDLLIERYGDSGGGQGTQADGLDFMPDGRLVVCFLSLIHI